MALEKTAIILGGGAKSKLFSWDIVDSPGVEIWGINFQKRDWVPRIDRMFNIHRYELLKKYGYRTYSDAMDAMDWYRARNHTRVILADKWPDNRMFDAEIFPANELRAAFPRGDYHCNSCDWLIAYALYLDFKTVILHGFNLEREGVIEQQSAAKCAEYWAGYATGRGMNLVIGKDSSMFGIYHLVVSNRVYGYDDCPAWEDRRPGATDPPYRYDDY